MSIWQTGARRRCLAPKQRLGLRVVSQLDPIDALLTTAIVVQIGERLEAIRLPREARVVHSHRYVLGLSHGRLFDPGFSFQSFRDRSLELVEERGGLILLTDISDFYPRLYLHRVENALRSALHPDDGAVRVLIKFLRQWNQAISYGLPVGASAFRLVAETTINDIDQALAAEGYTLCRYSDDYRIFVSSEREAREALVFLARVLSDNHGLTLQLACRRYTVPTRIRSPRVPRHWHLVSGSLVPEPPRRALPDGPMGAPGVSSWSRMPPN